MKQAYLEDVPHIRWSSLTPDGISPAVEEALVLAEKGINEVASQEPSKATFASTYGALELATQELDRAWGRVGHLDSVCNSDALREVYNEWLPKVSAFHAQIALNDGLWQALKAVAENPDQVRALSPVEKRLVEETLREFRENGADLPPKEKARLEEVKKELAEKTQKFSENVLDATNAFELIVEDEARLEGLPEMAKEGAKALAASKEGEDDGKEPRWRFTLQAPSLVPVLQYLEDDEIRRELWTAFSNVGREEPNFNGTLLKEILALRQEVATLLGKRNFADHVLQSRMAKDGKTALGFVEDLHDRIRDQFASEVEELEAFKAEETNSSAGALEPWELGFWAEKLRKQRYDFDGEALRPYFAIDQVIDGMFAIVQEIFGIRIEEVNTVFHETPQAEPVEGEVEVWHSEVKFYNIYDGEGDLLGGFYADWHPRESKRGGAWMNYLRTGQPPEASESGKREPHIGLICGNLTPSVEGKPALLNHGEVETVFHEFGHLLHHLLGNVAVRSLNGVNVVWDFVELPSQIMENFCWERVSLDRFARHVETGEPIPNELFDKMIAAKNFQSAMGAMRQLSFGKMDLDLHFNYAKHIEGDLDANIDTMLGDYQIRTKSPRPNNSQAFNHLFSSPTGYAAGYYSYKWAEVLDADAFTRFQQDGVLSAKVGREFREKILSQGNAREAGELFRDFMGRDPDLQALLIRSGLTAA
ncbi:M3 family metallopeptidase [Verrucomicrobiales bacterium]|jgi:oligopeptidase A|nr:M3 family metallopeptidase [Verrucomicrobiales bacterium]MDF1784242.1 M3 family metallopeptidase [Verrucomicrobiales bacterium]